MKAAFFFAVLGLYQFCATTTCAAEEVTRLTHGRGHRRAGCGTAPAGRPACPLGSRRPDGRPRPVGKHTHCSTSLRRRRSSSVSTYTPTEHPRYFSRAQFDWLANAGRRLASVRRRDAQRYANRGWLGCGIQNHHDKPGHRHCAPEYKECGGDRSEDPSQAGGTNYRHHLQWICRASRGMGQEWCVSRPRGRRARCSADDRCDRGRQLCATRRAMSSAGCRCSNPKSRALPAKRAAMDKPRRAGGATVAPALLGRQPEQGGAIFAWRRSESSGEVPGFRSPPPPLARHVRATAIGGSWVSRKV